MASSGCGSGVVGYNVQVAVDTEHHLIVAHEVTNSGSDWAQLANIASQAKTVLVANSNVLIKLLQEVLDYKPRRGDNRPAPAPTSPIGDRHLVAGDLQDDLLAGFGAHVARSDAARGTSNYRVNRNGLTFSIGTRRSAPRRRPRSPIR